MVRVTRFRYAVAVALALLLTTFTAFTGADADIRLRQKQNQQKNGAPGAANPSASAGVILWREPTDIESRDLYYGPGGRDSAPDPRAPFTFVRHSKKGTQKKVIVEDNQGREWTVKFGREARPETTATRIVWAVGYFVDHTYFVQQARITGKENIAARNVRFKLRDDGYEEIGNWAWGENPFVGTRELEGLKVLMALLKNWDLRSDNNEIMTRKKKSGPWIYYVSDLGATFGRTGTFVNGLPLFGDWPTEMTFAPQKAKGHPKAFAGEKFIKEVRDGQVVFNSGRTRARNPLKGVSVTNARWMGNLLGRLSDKQLADAFSAGGFDQFETAIYVRTLRERITQLQQL